MLLYADWILRKDPFNFHEIKEGTPQGEKYIDLVKEDALGGLGYFLRPSELFSEVARRGKSVLVVRVDPK